MTLDRTSQPRGEHFCVVLGVSQLIFRAGAGYPESYFRGFPQNQQKSIKIVIYGTVASFHILSNKSVSNYPNMSRKLYSYGVLMLFN